MLLANSAAHAVRLFLGPSTCSFPPQLFTPFSDNRKVFTSIYLINCILINLQPLARIR